MLGPANYQMYNRMEHAGFVAAYEVLCNVRFGESSCLPDANSTCLVEFHSAIYPALIALTRSLPVPAPCAYRHGGD